MFPERQIIVRVDADVRYLTLRTRTQVAVVALMTGLAGWSAFATLDRDHRADVISRQQKAITDLRHETVRLDGMLASARAHYTSATSDLARQYGELRRLLATRGELEQELAETRHRLAAAEADYQQSRTLNADLDRQVSALDAELTARKSSNHEITARLTEMAAALEGAADGRAREAAARQRQAELTRSAEARLAETRAELSDLSSQVRSQQRELQTALAHRDIAMADAARLSDQLNLMRQDLGSARNTNVDLRRRLAATADALTNTHEGQMVAERRGMELADLVDSLEGRLAQVRENQLTLLEDVQERARRNVDTLERTLIQTGLPLDRLLAAAGAVIGRGGPLLTVETPENQTDPDSFEQVVATLEDDLGRWEAVQYILERVPLARPTLTGYISSPFGRRKDPINGRTSLHKGIDIAAPPRTRVHATAPGIVTFADWNGAYGRMVEIDHGAGFVTRYGHLQSISVKVGQRLAFHDEIGRMGSSGRSTGSHVHYELEFEGEHLDPQKFLKAGRYVFKVEDARG